MKIDSFITGSYQAPVSFPSSSGAAMNPGTHPLYCYPIENTYEPSERYLSRISLELQLIIFHDTEDGISGGMNDE